MTRAIWAVGLAVLLQACPFWCLGKSAQEAAAFFQSCWTASEECSCCQSHKSPPPQQSQPDCVCHGAVLTALATVGKSLGEFSNHALVPWEFHAPLLPVQIGELLSYSKLEPRVLWGAKLCICLGVLLR